MIECTTFRDLIFPFLVKALGEERACGMLSETPSEFVAEFKNEILSDIQKYGGSAPFIYKRFQELKEVSL